MPPSLPWPASRMEWKPVDMTVTYDGDGKFVARTGDIAFPMEAPVGMGGHGNAPNPIQYLVGSLGGCVGVKILLALADSGIATRGLAIGIHGTRRKTMPATFDRVQLTVTLEADADEALVARIVDETLARLCPIAAMFAEVGEVTAEHRIVRRA